MTDIQPAEQVFTDDQLHGKACFEEDCGATDDLAPAGHVYTQTQRGKAPLGWAVTACPAHTPKKAR